MKFKLLAVLLFFPFSVFANINIPPANSVCGNAYGYEVCVWPTYAAGGFDDEYGLRSSYRSSGGDEWVFLSEKTHFISNFTNKETTDNYFQTFVDGINDAIEAKLKPISIEPESGVDRIKWLVGRLSFSNNQLIYTP